MLDRYAYLNAGTFGPLPRATVEAMQAVDREELELGRSSRAYFERVLAEREALRGQLARLIGAPTEQVALTGSTTDGCNIVLGGLGLTSDDEVVTTSHEHFGLLGALGASAAQVVVAEPEPERILAAVSPRTRLIAVSQVLWTTGRVLPVRSMRERAGVPVIVVSTELDEVAALADRVAVMYRGAIIGIVPGDTPRDVLGLMMAGETPESAGAAA